MNNFWNDLNKPIYALAPMAGITDVAFRQICKSFKADIVYSEMASATALVYSPKKTLNMLISNKIESPYVIQLFGDNPDYFAKAVKILTDKKKVKDLGIKGYRIPDGIDINFGCPVKKILKQRAGSALFQNLKISREIIKIVIETTDLPVSIKMRTEAGNIDCLEFLKYMQDLDIKAVMIHGRTLKQGFSGDVNSDIIRQARKYFKGIILANGGVVDVQTAYKLLDGSKADGIGLARGVLGNPWLFRQLKESNRKLNNKISDNKDKKEVFKVILKHAKLVNKYNLNFNEFRKHLCAYVTGLEGARQMRSQFIGVSNIDDIKKVIKEFK